MRAADSNHPLPVIVVGGGPVGLSVAMLLVEQGIRVLVLEREAALMEDMRASTFHPATLDIIHRHGLANALVAQGTPVPKWQYMQHGSDRRVVFDMGVLTADTAFPFRLQCEQYRLTRAILARLDDHPLLDVRFDSAVTAVMDDGEGVRVEVGGESLRADWLVAADGASSTVRKLLALPFAGHVFPKTSITLVVDYPFEQVLPGLLGVNYVWTEDGHYSLMKLRDRWRLSYSPDQSQSVEQALSEPVAQAHLQSLLPRAEDYTILQRSYYTLHQRCLQRFVVGRTLFVGDAAHLNSPAGGMGMNSGIHDANCLVEHLAPVIQGADSSLLQRYDRRRRTIATDEVQRLSAKNYARHRETDAERRAAIWQELEDIAASPGRMRDYLLDAAMIRSLQIEQEID